MICMNKKGLTAVLALWLAVTGASGEPWMWTSYASGGVGALATGPGIAPLAETSAGIVVNPWLAVGGVGAVVPLSQMHSLSLGPNLANVDAAYAAPSGTEVILTPWVGEAFYPMFRVAVGGISLGYLEDADDEEGFERAVQDRFFYASAAVGMEWKLLSFVQVGVRGEWSWAPHKAALGLQAGAAGGPSLVVSVRTHWKTLYGE